MSRTSPILESFPVERQLTNPDSIRTFRSTYDRLRRLMDGIELEARLQEAAAKGWIVLPSRVRRRLTPARLPGRPLSELLDEVRD